MGLISKSCHPVCREEKARTYDELFERGWLCQDSQTVVDS